MAEAQIKDKEKIVGILPTTDIASDALKGEVLKLKADGYRFVTMTCVDLDEDNVDLIYAFDRDLEMVHYRLKQPKAQPACPSPTSCSRPFSWKTKSRTSSASALKAWC
jgi:ech hydrogenase subunit D